MTTKPRQLANAFARMTNGRVRAALPGSGDASLRAQPRQDKHQMGIEVSRVSKKFGSFAALDDVSFTVKEGELLALLGPSGSGKTTLLRIIAGLERPDTGAVFFDGADATRRDPRDRGVGFVFQHYALFRHMTVHENVAFGLRVRPRAERPSDAEIRARVRELLSLVQLDYLGDRYPSELSGGQRQRVALARALAVQPKVLLLDEPFGALDAKVRQDLRRWLRRLHADIHLTSVFVTHDQEEALELANRVVVMNEGRIEQDGTPDDVLEQPATPFVVNFIGNVNIFHGRVQDGRAVLGPIAVAFPDHPHAEARDASGYARPHELDLSREEDGGGLWVTVTDVRASGALVKIEAADRDGSLIRVELGRAEYDAIRVIAGERVYLKPRRVRVFVDPTEDRVS
jgi:sulfate/thiosulfate transport system ATP-binding protein